MKNIIKFTIVYIICSASSCDKLIPDRVSSFWVQNNSTQKISISHSIKYPDTTIAHIKRFEVDGISPNERAPVDSRKDWEKVINEDIPGKKLLVFVFSIPVNDTNWDSVRNNYLVQKRYELTVDDLKAMKWVVEFP